MITLTSRKHAAPTTLNSLREKVFAPLSDTFLSELWFASEGGFTEADKEFYLALQDELIRRTVLARKPDGGAELS
jgi:hypothetical protein